MGEWHEIERFMARSEDGAHETTVIVRQMVVPAATRGNPSGVARGQKSAQTIDGQPCNYLSEGRFEITGTGMVLARV